MEKLKRIRKMDWLIIVAAVWLIPTTHKTPLPPEAVRSAIRRLQ